MPSLSPVLQKHNLYLSLKFTQHQSELWFSIFLFFKSNYTKNYTNCTNCQTHWQPNPPHMPLKTLDTTLSLQYHSSQNTLNHKITPKTQYELMSQETGATNSVLNMAGNRLICSMSDITALKSPLDRLPTLPGNYKKNKK